MGIKVASRGLIDSYDYCVHFSSFHGKGANLWSMSDWVLGARLETLCLEAVFCFGGVSGLFFLTPYSFSESILVFLFLLAPQMQSCILVLPLQYPPCPPRPAPILPSNPCAHTHTSSPTKWIWAILASQTSLFSNSPFYLINATQFSIYFLLLLNVWNTGKELKG